MPSESLGNLWQARKKLCRCVKNWWSNLIFKKKIPKIKVTKSAKNYSPRCDDRNYCHKLLRIKLITSIKNSDIQLRNKKQKGINFFLEIWSQNFNIWCVHQLPARGTNTYGAWKALGVAHQTCLCWPTPLGQPATVGLHSREGLVFPEVLFPFGTTGFQ